MILNDVYRLAKALEDTLPDIAKENNGQNVRGDIEMTIHITSRELDAINRELYIQSNKDLYGYEESDEVIIEVFGIKFTLLKKES